MMSSVWSDGELDILKPHNGEDLGRRSACRCGTPSTFVYLGQLGSFGVSTFGITLFCDEMLKRISLQILSCRKCQRGKPIEHMY